MILLPLASPSLIFASAGVPSDPVPPFLGDGFLEAWADLAPADAEAAEPGDQEKPAADTAVTPDGDAAGVILPSANVPVKSPAPSFSMIPAASAVGQAADLRDHVVEAGVDDRAPKGPAWPDRPAADALQPRARGVPTRSEESAEKAAAGSIPRSDKQDPASDNSFSQTAIQQLGIPAAEPTGGNETDAPIKSLAPSGDGVNVHTRSPVPPAPHEPALSGESVSPPIADPHLPDPEKKLALPGAPAPRPLQTAGTDMIAGDMDFALVQGPTDAADTRPERDGQARLTMEKALALRTLAPRPPPESAPAAISRVERLWSMQGLIADRRPAAIEEGPTPESADTMPAPTVQVARIRPVAAGGILGPGPVKDESRLEPGAEVQPPTPLEQKKHKSDGEGKSEPAASVRTDVPPPILDPGQQTAGSEPVATPSPGPIPAVPNLTGPAAIATIPSAPPPPVFAPMVMTALRTEAAHPTEDGVTLILSPEELGTLHLKMIAEGDRLQVAFAVERPETLDLLRRHVEQFAQDLRQAGFASASFSFTQGGSQGSAQPPQYAPFADATSDPAPPPGAPHPSTLPHPAASSGLDLRL
jgi:Flagellar hook-length control protein FliK